MTRLSRPRSARHLAVVPAAALGLLLAAGAPAPAFAGRHSMTISTGEDDAGPLERCDQVRVAFGDALYPRPMARKERVFRMNRDAVPVLAMHLDGPGGVSVSGWSQEDYSVTACFAAAGKDEARAARLLESVDARFDGGRLAMHGPEEEDWMVYFIVRVPKDAALDLKSENEPIDLRDVRGRIKARTENGPIALTRCSGEIEVAAENGPVSVQAGGGRQRLSVANGPLAIQLEGKRWDGAGIDADVENGPVSVKIPEHYESGVSLEMSGHAPLSCRNGCRGEFEEGNGRRLLFGASSPVIRISSGNGPVDIDSGSPSRRSKSI